MANVHFSKNLGYVQREKKKGEGGGMKPDKCAFQFSITKTWRTKGWNPKSMVGRLNYGYRFAFILMRPFKRNEGHNQSTLN